MTAAAQQGHAEQAKKPRVTEDQLAAAVVVGMHRLVKQSTLYTTENEAQRRQLELTQRAVLAYGRRTGRNPKIYFAERSVFICGRMLRAGRVIYDAALELGEILKRFGVDEVTIGFDVPVEELKLFQKATAEALRGGQSPAKRHYTRLRLKRGLPPGRRPDDDDLSPQEILVRGYCTSIVVMRRFFEAIQTGKHMLPVRVRRVAQQLSDLGAIESPAFLGTTALYNARHENAGRAVNSAMVAIGMARQITDDGRLLARIAMATLLYDVGLPRVAGQGPTGEGRVGMAFPKLVEHQYPDWPPATAAMTTALGGLGEASLTHTVLCYEAIWHNCRNALGPPYGGLRPVTMEARIVAVARRFNELLSDPDEELNADRAVAQMLREATDDADQTAVRLLMCALGLFPTGTLVELSNGQIAQVVRNADSPIAFSTPIVRPVINAAGGSVGQAQEIDLSQDASLHIKRLVATGDDREVRAAEDERARQENVERRAGLSDLPQPPKEEPPARPREKSYGPNTLDSEFDGVFGHSRPDHDAQQVTLDPNEQNLDYGAQYGSEHTSGEYPDYYGGSQAQGHAPAYGDAQAYGESPYGQSDYEGAPASPYGAEPSARDEATSYDDVPAHGAPQAADALQPVDQQPPSLEPPPQDDVGFELEEEGIVDEPTNPIPDAAELASSLEPPGAAQSAAAPAAPDDDFDEDDVPSMVLQAIVDGRSQHTALDDDDDDRTSVFRGDRNQLHALFFQGEGPQGRAMQPRPDRPADSGRASQEGSPLPREGIARRAGSSTPTGIHQVNTAALEHARKRALEEQTESPLAMPAERAADRAPMAMPPQRRAERAEAQEGGAIALGPGPAQRAEAPKQDQGEQRRGSRTIEWLKRVLTAHRPASQGDSTKTPLLHLFVYMLDRRLTGTLMLVTGEFLTHFVYFEEGVPSKVRTSGEVAPLDRVLTEMSVLDAQSLAESLAEVSKTGELHGRYLVKKGLLDVGAVTGALQWQLIRKVGYMLKLPADTKYAYYEGANLLEDYGGPQLTPADPLAIIMTGVRVLGRAPIVIQTLKKLGQTPLRIRREADIRRLHLKDPEQRVVDLLRARPMTLAELLSKQLAHPLAIELTIYALVITRCLNLGANQKPPVGYGVPAVPLRWDPSDAPRPSGSGDPGEAPGRASRPSAPGAGRPSRPGTGVPSSTGRPNMRRSTSGRGTSGRGAIPRRGTTSARSSQPLPRRGTSSARGQPLPRRGSSSMQDQAAQAGPSSPGRASSPGRRAPAPSSPQASAQSGPIAGQGLPPRVRGATGAFRGGGSSPGGGPPSPRASSPQSPSPQSPSPQSPSPQSPSPRSPSPRSPSPRSSSQGSPRAGGARAQRGSTGRGAAAGQPPPGSLQREEIEEWASKLDDQTYFEILGIGEKASSSEVQSAYFKLAKSWHPDRLDLSLSDVKPKVAAVFARINEAYQTLSNDEKRSEYEETVKHGGGTARDREMVERVIDSALLFQKGEVMFRKGSYEKAAEMVKQAVDADPDQPEYRALLAWIEAHCLGQPPETAGDRRHFYRDQIKMLDAVIKQEPEYERALFYRGSLLKRSGFAEAALKDFRKVVQLNPRNIDAAREVRLNKIRAKKEEKGGLLGRFFGKDK